MKTLSSNEFVVRPHWASNGWTRRCKNWFVAAAVWLSILLVVSITASSEETEDILEYKVKAGFLVNFARFVEWPADSVPATNSPILIGLLADDPATPTLRRALEGKIANGRPLTVVLLRDTVNIGACQIFFFSRVARVKPDEVVKQAKGTATVTVGEIDQFAQHGGIINFVRKNDSFRFEVNLVAAENSRLKISAKIASMAIIVRPALP